MAYKIRDGHWRGKSTISPGRECCFAFSTYPCRIADFSGIKVRDIAKTPFHIADCAQQEIVIYEKWELAWTMLKDITESLSRLSLSKTSHEELYDKLAEAMKKCPRYIICFDRDRAERPWRLPQLLSSRSQEYRQALAAMMPESLSRCKWNPPLPDRPLDATEQFKIRKLRFTSGFHFGRTNPQVIARDTMDVHNIPLHLAARIGAEPKIEKLLKRAPSLGLGYVNGRNDVGQTPFDLAPRCRYTTETGFLVHDGGQPYSR